MAAKTDPIVQVALTQIGVHEEPPGSNSGAMVREYQAATFLAGTGWPWCVAFYCWCNKKAGKALPYPTAGSYDLLNWAKRTGNSPSTPLPGDGVVFHIGSGHVGILVRSTAANVVTIDGNWGDAVAEHTTSKSLVAGYVRNPGLMPGEHMRLPRIVIATSINGTRKVLFRTRTRAGAAKWLSDHTLAHFQNGITITRPHRKKRHLRIPGRK